MNEEAAVVMMFFTFRVFLVGTIAVAYPRIARKGLVFGTYLGEENAEGAVRRQLLREWDRGTALIMLAALVVGWGIGLSGRWIPGNFIGTVVLLVPFLPLYVWVNRKAQSLAPADAARQGRTSTAILEVDKGRGDTFAAVALAACVVGSLAVFVHAAVAFRSMPDRIPTLANLWGYGDEVANKSLVPVVLIPSFNLVLAPFFAVYAFLVAHAKRSVRGGSGGGSAQAQDTFRVAFSHFFAGTGLFTCLFLGVVSWQMVKVWQGRAESLGGIAIGSVSVVMILYMGGTLFRVMMMGQGGARLETGSAATPLTGGLADNAHWVMGIWYVNRTDPALMVETRWGIGYTMNLGNRTAQVLLGVFGLALLGLAALTLATMGVFS